MRSNEEKARRSSVLIIARSALVGFIICGILFAAAALAVAKGVLSESGMKPAASLIAFAASCAGGCVAAKCAGRQRLLFGLLTGSAMFVVCAASQLAVSSSGFPNAWTAALLGVLAGGGTFGGFVSAAGRPRRR